MRSVWSKPPLMKRRSERLLIGANILARNGDQLGRVCCAQRYRLGQGIGSEPNASRAARSGVDPRNGVARQRSRHPCHVDPEPIAPSGSDDGVCRRQGRSFDLQQEPVQAGIPRGGARCAGLSGDGSRQRLQLPWPSGSAMRVGAVLKPASSGSWLRSAVFPSGGPPPQRRSLT